jgi:hypothetical protein
VPSYRTGLIQHSAFRIQNFKNHALMFAAIAAIIFLAATTGSGGGFFTV